MRANDHESKNRLFNLNGGPALVAGEVEFCRRPQNPPSVPGTFRHRSSRDARKRTAFAVDHRFREAGAGGSNPLTPTSFRPIHCWTSVPASLPKRRNVARTTRHRIIEIRSIKGHHPRRVSKPRRYDGSASVELARPHDFGVEPLDRDATVMGIGCRSSWLQMDEPAPWHAKGRSNQHTDAVNLDRQRKFVERATAANPRIHVARAPVVCGDRVGPAAVSTVHLSQIGAPERPVLPLVKAVATADIYSRGRRNLHRSLRPVWVGAPHLRIGPVIGFGSLD